MFILRSDFDIYFICTLSFAWRVAVITAASWVRDDILAWVLLVSFVRLHSPLCVVENLRGFFFAFHEAERRWGGAFRRWHLRGSCPCLDAVLAMCCTAAAHEASGAAPRPERAVGRASHPWLCVSRLASSSEQQVAVASSSFQLEARLIELVDL